MPLSIKLELYVSFPFNSIGWFLPYSFCQSHIVYKKKKNIEKKDEDQNKKSKIPARLKRYKDRKFEIWKNIKID